MGGMIARRLFPLLIVAPLFLGWARLQGQYLGFYGLEFGLALFTVTMILTLSLVVWWTAHRLNHMDQQHQEAQRLAELHRGELAHALRVNTMGEMVAGIAHELNQPLSAIANFAQGTARRLDNDRGEHVELIAAGQCFGQILFSFGIKILLQWA